MEAGLFKRGEGDKRGGDEPNPANDPESHPRTAPSCKPTYRARLNVLNKSATSLPSLICNQILQISSVIYMGRLIVRRRGGKEDGI